MTLSYEDALELQEAGFAQILGHDFIFPNGTIVRGNEPLEADPEMASAPTLSELISAIGKDFHGLTVDDDGVWGAHARGSDKVSLGDTPDSAVAKLWLTLQ